MKLKSFYQTLLILLAFISLTTFVGCSKDSISPAPPVDETVDKGHEEWGKVTFTFTKGHLHGSLFHGDPINPETKYFVSKQEISFEVDEKGNVVPSTTEPIRFIKDVHYGLEITYYNKNGERMNSEFTNAEMAPIHQHFFLNKNVKDLLTNKDLGNHLDIFKYSYRDTDPEDQMFYISPNAKLRPKNDPIGLKGYFYITDKYKTFDLNILLVHVVKGTKLDDNGNPYPFDKPSKRILGTQDLNIKIPVKIYTEHPGGSDAEVDKFIKDIAREFNITEEEAYDDWDKSFDAPHDSSKYYM